MSKDEYVLAQSPEELCSSQVNHSISKAQYTIPKSKRFTPVIKPSENMNAFYPLPNQLSKRSASFGYGEKFNFSKLVPCSPGPGAYTNT